jgi:D-threo-aldose 1-dehydrogenase
VTTLDDPIQPRELPGTTLRLSPITLGTSPLDDPDLAQALLTGPYAAVDTSNVYAGGASETALGVALGRLDGDHRSVITKTDAEPETRRFDRDRVLASFEESLERLGLARIELLHLHDPYSISIKEAFGPGGAVEGMRELKEQGLVDLIGIAAGTGSLMTEYVSSGAFDAVLSHNRYTLIDNSAALFEDAHQRGMVIFNAAPFGGGLLAGRGTRYAYQESTPELLDWVARADALCTEHGITLPAAALHFSLRSPLIHSTVIGVGSPERITQVEKLRSTEIPDAFWPALDRLGPAPSTITD